jgi:MtN3 and saliva related transmembrane protein
MDQALVTEGIGWASSAILFATLCSQIWRQWQARRTEGVSSWLFAGQLAASIGFTAYSYLVGNTVFVVTNGLLAVTAIVGWLVLRIHRRREASEPRGRAEPRSPTAKAAAPP